MAMSDSWQKEASRLSLCSPGRSSSLHTCVIQWLMTLGGVEGHCHLQLKGRSRSMERDGLSCAELLQRCLRTYMYNQHHDLVLGETADAISWILDDNCNFPLQDGMECGTNGALWDWVSGYCREGRNQLWGPGPQSKQVQYLPYYIGAWGIIPMAGFCRLKQKLEEGWAFIIIIMYFAGIRYL